MQNPDLKLDTVSLKCKELLYALVSTLVFEGILRKILPAAVGLGLFFLKDLMCLAALYVLFNLNFTGIEGRMYSMWRTLFWAFIPLIINTGSYEVALGVFGPKQYMLYVVTALLVPLAFPPQKLEEFKKFCAFLAILLIPTTLIAMLQNSLPATHWLNRTVGGDSLIAFSAAGFLRVSSTFSFTGQFSWFLNLACVFFMIRFFLPPLYTHKLLRSTTKHLTVVLGLMLIIGAFITGGRTAVIGCGSCLLLGFFLSGLKNPRWIFNKAIFIVIFSVGGISVLSTIKPEFFAAYNERSSGSKTMSHQAEVEGRILDSYTSWTEWFGNQKLLSVIFGNGLGVMSNGSEQLSEYAREKRANGFWTENDVSTTFWEGGLYLAVIWYAFRLSLILFCIRIWRSLKTPTYALASSFALSFIIIIGVNGTLGIQPPLAIWWFLCVGSMFTFKNFDQLQQIVVTADLPGKNRRLN